MKRMYLIMSLVFLLLTGCSNSPEDDASVTSDISQSAAYDVLSEPPDEDQHSVQDGPHEDEDSIQPANNKNNFLIRNTSDGIFLCGPVNKELGIYYKETDSDIWVSCYKGNAILGPIYRNYLYFISADFENNKVSMERINISSLQKETLSASNSLSIDNIAVYSNLLIIYTGNDLSNGMVFEIDENNDIAKEGVSFREKLSDHFREGEYRISADYSQIYYIDNTKDSDAYLFHMDDLSYRYLNRIGEIKLTAADGVLFSNDNFLYYLNGSDGNITKIAEIEENLYLITQSGNSYYGVLQQNDNRSSCIRMDPEGNQYHICDFENVKFPSRLAISVSGNDLFYYDNLENEVYTVDLLTGNITVISNS